MGLIRSRTFRQATGIFIGVLYILTPALIAAKESAKTGQLQITVTAENPPKLKPTAVTMDSQACGNERPSQTVLVDDENHLRNVVVWLEGENIEPVAPDSEAEKDIYIRNCEFTPRVLIVTPQTSIRFHNEDGILHSIRTRGQKNLPSTRVHPPALKISTIKLEKVELVPLASDLHTWMKGFVFVVPHAHYAVTGNSGKASLKKINYGTYKLKLWHEFYGTLDWPEDVQINKSSKSISVHWNAEISQQ